MESVTSVAGSPTRTPSTRSLSVIQRIALMTYPSTMAPADSLAMGLSRRSMRWMVPQTVDDAHIVDPET
jgi:hypothetical protein